MSYYSDVFVCMLKEDYDAFIKRVNEIKNSELKEDILRLIHEADSYDPYDYCGNDNNEFKDKFIALEWNYYDHWDIYCDRRVSFFMEYLKLLNDFQYIRIGENYDDIEEISSCVKTYDVLVKNINVSTVWINKPNVVYEVRIGDRTKLFKDFNGAEYYFKGLFNEYACSTEEYKNALINRSFYGEKDGISVKCLIIERIIK